MELKYKIGDKVLVEVTVDSLDLNDHRWPYSVTIGDEGDNIWLSESSLEAAVTAATGKPPKQGNNIEVGDIIELKGGLRTTVALVGDNYVYSLEYGEDFYISDIVAIYKKSWEKPKELEEMSKEELIELVKKLKGEVI